MTRPGHRGDPFAGVPGRRLFVGVALPPSAVQSIVEVVESVRAMGLPSGDRDVRWVRLDGLHITLRFIGPTLDDRIEPVAEAVRAVAAAAAGPIDVEIGGTGTFPSPHRPRSLWLGLRSGVDELAALAADVDAALERLGMTFVTRPFRPHLTLARSDGIRAGALVADRLAAVLGDRRIPFVVDDVGLFESVTGGGPARYVPVTSAALGSMR